MDGLESSYLVLIFSLGLIGFILPQPIAQGRSDSYIKNSIYVIQSVSV